MRRPWLAIAIGATLVAAVGAGVFYAALEHYELPTGAAIALSGFAMLLLLGCEFIFVTAMAMKRDV